MSSNAIQDWANHKNKKVAGLADGTWNAWDNVTDLPADAFYALPAYMQGQREAGLNDQGSTNPYSAAQDLYDQAKEVAQKKHDGEKLSSADNSVGSAWTNLVLSGKP